MGVSRDGNGRGAENERRAESFAIQICTRNRTVGSWDMVYEVMNMIPPMQLEINGFSDQVCNATCVPTSSPSECPPQS